MKLAFFDTKPYDRPGFDRCTQGSGIEITYFEDRLNESTVTMAAGYDAVCVFVSDELNAAVIHQLHSFGVQVIALRCAGFNNVDLDACAGRLRVFRVPAYSPHGVAEHAMALLLAMNRKLHLACNRTRQFDFRLSGLTGFDLYGKTVGIIGTGKIGRAFAQICQGFGLNILAYDLYPDPSTGLHYVDLPELFSQSDLISLHCPLNEQNYHLINQETIAMMKQGVYLVNVSRGAMIDTAALIEGLKSGKIGAACLDVYENENGQFYNDHSGHIMQDEQLAYLISMPNVLLTSHQAFLTEEALDRIASTTVDNLKQFLAGTPNQENEVLPC